MKEKIKANIENPGQLEKLYRSDKKGFKKAFFEIFPEISGSKISEFWKTRLEFERTKRESNKPRITDILFLLVSCAVAGFFIEIPRIFDLSMEKDLFYAKNAGMIVFSGLSFFAFLTRDILKIKQILFAIFVFLLSAIYINLLPSFEESHSIFLACLHLPLMIWFLYGLIYINFEFKDLNQRMDYIRYNGDLAILLAIIALAGGILTGVTIGLFSAIEVDIEQFYFDYIVLLGLVAAPVVATYIIRLYPFITQKIVPVMASLFSPLVLLTLVIYLTAILFTGKDPYNDRDFLLVFNLMLLGVMAIIVFSISGSAPEKKQRLRDITLFALSIVTFIINLVALSAILYRLGEFGFTPNRTAVLGSNLLIFGNLILITYDLFRVNFKNKPVQQVGLTVARYLPVYLLWIIFVVFGFPILFGWQ